MHAETFPLVERDSPNPLELFQIWLNLPAEDKLVDPHFSMLWAEAIPQLHPGPGVTLTVIAGEVDGQVPPSPPPNSWATRTDTDVAIWHLRLEPDGRWTMPAAGHAETVRMLYVFEGDGLAIGGDRVGGRPAPCWTRRSGRADRRPRTSSPWCCRAARSVSRSPSTDRS